MAKIETKYGVLNDAAIAENYLTGEPESYRVEEYSELEILGYKLVPLYGFSDERRKELPSVKVFKNGNIKSISLNTLTSIQTAIGEFEVEKLTFYEEGPVNRLFFLDGKLTGFWSEEDEYNLAKAYDFNLEFSQFRAKIMSIHFYNTGELKSFTLWPKERINLSIGEYSFVGRIGASLYKNGKLKSCEPFRPIIINTPIGDIESYDINAIGIHGDSNSLNFYENGDVKSIITGNNTITVYTSEGEAIIHSPKKVRLYSNSVVMDVVTLKLEFCADKIIIDDKYEYDIVKNNFEIKPFGEKKFTLNGDINN